jgi:hypothetical protein
VRTRLLAVAALLLLGGCGNQPPPDEATSRELITTTVLDWHRLQAAGDGEAACRLLTDEQQAAVADTDRKLAASIGIAPPDSCVEAIARYKRFSDAFRDVMLSTQVDAVGIERDRARATVHTHVVINGAPRDTPPAQIGLRWVGGRWLID